MTIGTLFTLFVVPSVYVLIAKDHSRERERERARVAAQESGPVQGDAGFAASG
jgi:multidrug efflux pump